MAASSADVKPRHHNGSGHSPDSSLDARRGSEGTEYGPLTLPFSAKWRRRLSMDDVPGRKKHAPEKLQIFIKG